jgi:hypothetical protein
MNKKNLAIGVLASLAVGTGLGVILKSKKGASIKDKFTRSRIGYTHELEEKFNVLIDKITEEFNNLVLEVSQMAKISK